jgi:hypothetical protein
MKHGGRGARRRASARWRGLITAFALATAAMSAVPAAPALAQAGGGGDGAPSASARRGAELPRYGLALDVLSVWSRVARFRFERGLSDDLQLVALLGGGSPARSRLDRFSAVELGAGLDWYMLGDRRRGLGLCTSLRWRSGAGERADAFGQLPDVRVSSNAAIVDAGLSARVARRSGLFADARLALGWTLSAATAEQPDAELRDVASFPFTHLALNIGWMF